jgi:hypothetical protein
MVSDWFVVHEGLQRAARVPSLVRARERVSGAELVLLLACGVTAALAVAYVKLGLRIPGHSIVLAALPMVLGMSLAPRRLAGTVMGAGALGTAWLLSRGGGNFGWGASVSVCLLGPMMDVALLRVGRGWRLYGALVLSGLATNLVALGVRALPKVLGFDVADGRPFDNWWTQAIVTYTLSGIVAGLLGALCWFQATDRSERPVA